MRGALSRRTNAPNQAQDVYNDTEAMAGVGTPASWAPAGNDAVAYELSDGTEGAIYSPLQAGMLIDGSHRIDGSRMLGRREWVDLALASPPRPGSIGWHDPQLQAVTAAGKSGNFTVVANPIDRIWVPIVAGDAARNSVSVLGY